MRCPDIVRWFLAGWIAACSLQAQQLNVTVLLREPLPAAIAVWQEDPTVVRLLISSSTPTPAYPNAIVGFELRDIRTQRVVARSKDGHPRQPRVSIPAGPMSIVLTGPEIVAQEAVEVDPSIETQVLLTGFLPEGIYEFCVRLLDEQLRPIAATGRLCATSTVLVPTPPVLLTPEDTSRLRTPAPLFTWLPVQPTIGTVLYRIRIVPVYPGQDRRAAIDRNTPILEQTLPTTSLQYPVTAPPFELYPDAVAFAWQVQALTPDGRPAARNEGKSTIFLFYPPALPPSARSGDTTARRPPSELAPGAGRDTSGPQHRAMGAPSVGTGLDTVLVTHILLGGGFRMRLHTPVMCQTGSTCTIGPDTGYIYIPWLGDTLIVRFPAITITVPATGFALPQLVSGTITASILKERLLRTGAALVNHTLRLLEWEFSALTARVRSRLVVDWSSMNFSCRTQDSIELGWQPLGLTGLPPLRLKLPTAWNCTGVLDGPCFSLQVDSLIVHARFDTTSYAFSGELTLGGRLNITCLDPAINAPFYLRIDRGGTDFLLTVISSLNARVVGTPLRIRLDTLVLDLAQDLNPTGFPPSGPCSFPDWGSPAWRGAWLPSVRLSLPIGDNDTLDFIAQNVVVEDVGGQLKFSLSLAAHFTDTVRFAGFRIRLDTVRARWCRGAFNEFALRGLVLLPQGLSKPANWAQLDSLYIRFTCDASWNWTGSLDIYGQIQLTFGSYAKLVLQNGRIVKVAPGSGYVEFVNLRLYAPVNGSNSVAFNGLRIWNDGRVELEGAEGWINVSSWANLSVAGITIQVQEVGLGYHQPTGACSSSQKRWWIGLSGGISIDASSGLPGGGNGARVRRLRIYDNLCMTSEGAGIDVSISGTFSIRGDLQWGDITYGSGSGAVTAKGLRGSLSGSFTCLGGVEAQIDFALGSTGSPAYNFWFVQGAVVVPGGVPIVPGAFHLVGGILGAGWHVRLDNVNKDLISETSGIVPPPPIVPDPNTSLLLRGGLIFADASVQFYRLTVTGTVVIGSSMQLGIDGGITVLPAIRLVEGGVSASVSISNGRLQPPISLSGSVAVRLGNIPVFSTGFHSTIQPGAPCFTVGTLNRNWILVDLDANVGNDILGAEVVAKAYASLWGFYLRLCPDQGQFQGTFSGAGVVGVKLNVAGVGSVPFHFGLGFSSGFCGYYYFRFSRSGNSYVGQAKLGGGLDLSLTFDQSGWWSWGWKGTQAADHLQGYYCGSGNWVDLSQHWQHCRKQDRCDKPVQDCRWVSITLRARGLLDGTLTIPRTCFTVAGRQICLPKLHQMSLNIQYGYYGYGKWNNREGAKKGGPLANAAEALTCASLSNEAATWANANVAEQQPPALVVTSSPGRGQSGFNIAQPLRVELGAPADGNWSSGGSGLRQWQIRNLTLSLWDLGTGTPRQVAIDWTVNGSTVSITPMRQVGSIRHRSVLFPNTQYRLVLAGDFWAKDPNGAQTSVSVSSDTILFTTGTPEGWRFFTRAAFPVTRLRDTVTRFTPQLFQLYTTSEPWASSVPALPLEFGRDLWLRIRDAAGRTYEWRGPTTVLIRSVAPILYQSVLPVGVQMVWDTLLLQPIVGMTGLMGTSNYAIMPNTFSFTVLNAKKAGSTAARPDTANRLLDGLPLEIDYWRWIRWPAAGEAQLQLSTQVSWTSGSGGDALPPPAAAVGEGSISYTVYLSNTGSQRIFAGTPFVIIVRKNVAGTVMQSQWVWHLPQVLPPGSALPVSVTVPTEPGYQGASIRILPRAPFSESNRADNCVDTGSAAGCAQCQPPLQDCSAIPVPSAEE